MKMLKRGLLAGILALVVILSSSGIAIADDGESNMKDNYYPHIYKELVKHGGQKWIKPIPHLSNNKFATYAEAYDHVKGLAASGYAFDSEVWGQEDYWAKSKKTNKLMLGDCDDWAIYLAALLIYHTEQVTDAWVACGLVSVPDDGVGIDGNAPRPYEGGHFWVVIPVGDDVWMVLDPVYPDVAADAENQFVIKQYIPDLGGEFYISEAYLEIFRFNQEQVTGFPEALLEASAALPENQ